MDAAGRSRHAALEAKQKQQLRHLKDTLRELWTTRAVPAADILAFLKRLQAAIPYTTAVHRKYTEKISSLRASTPILQAITRREVLVYRLHHCQAAMDDLVREMTTAVPGQMRDTQRKLSQLQVGEGCVCVCGNVVMCGADGVVNLHTGGTPGD